MSGSKNITNGGRRSCAQAQTKGFILSSRWQEATDEFDAIHSAKAKGMLKEYLIGRLGEAPRAEPALPAPEEKKAEVCGVYLGF